MHTGTTPPPATANGGGRQSAAPSAPTTPPPKAKRHLRRSSSFASDAASFHSAVDDLPGQTVGDFSNDDEAAAAAADELAPPTWLAPLLDNGPPTPPVSRILPSQDRPLHPEAPPSVAEDERAETWSQTRAGKRVSLAEVPTETVRRISLQLRRNSVEDMRRRAARESRAAVGRSGLGPGAAATLNPADAAAGAGAAGAGRRRSADADDDAASLLTIDTVTPAGPPAHDAVEPDRIFPVPLAPQ